MAALERFNSIQRQRHQETLRTILYNRGDDVIHYMEDSHKVFDWKVEQHSDEWKNWWRRKICTILLLFLWHFGCIFILATVSILWEPVQITYDSFVASISLFGRILVCFIGRKIHTGKCLTRILIFIDGLMSAYMYNAFAVKVMWNQYDFLIYLPAAVALSSVLAYILILLIVGIQLTNVRFNGLKFLPVELCAASIILCQLPYVFIIDKKHDIAYHEYMAHILTGELIGFILCSGMACYILAKLTIAIDKKTVQDALSLYALGPPSEPLPMELV